ncbi:MAG: thioesterase family protein [Chloroflexota bacterium]
MRVYTTIEQAQQLPCYHRQIIPKDYLDVMGHMNVRYYMALFDEGGWSFFRALGMDEAYYRDNNAGGFALRQYITYVAEARVNETVAVHTRIIARSDKRIHFVHFLVNESNQTVSATMEGIGSHADLTQRRTSPYPLHIVAKMDAMLSEHNALEWDAPLCGILEP